MPGNRNSRGDRRRTLRMAGVEVQADQGFVALGQGDGFEHGIDRAFGLVAQVEILSGDAAPTGMDFAVLPMTRRVEATRSTDRPSPVPMRSRGETRRATSSRPRRTHRPSARRFWIVVGRRIPWFSREVRSPRSRSRGPCADGPTGRRPASDRFRPLRPPFGRITRSRSNCKFHTNRQHTRRTDADRRRARCPWLARDVRCFPAASCREAQRAQRRRQVTSERGDAESAAWPKESGKHVQATAAATAEQDRQDFA